MTEAILPHGTSKFCFWSLQNTKSLFNKQETVGSTRLTTTLPKIQRAFSPPIKIWWHNITLGYIYNKIALAISSHIFYHSCRYYLKPSANFGNIGKQSLSFKFIMIKWLNDYNIWQSNFSLDASNCHLVQFNCDL